MRVSKDRVEEYQQALGLPAPISVKDPRIWIGHFAQDEVVAKKRGVVGMLEVTLAPHALPTQTDEQIRAAHGTAQGGQLLRSEAENKIPPWDAGYGKGGKDDRRRIEELGRMIAGESRS